MIEFIVFFCLLVGAALLAYGCGVLLPKIISTASRMKTKNEHIHGRLWRTNSKRATDRFGYYNGDAPFFDNLAEDVMDSLITYWETSRAFVDHINSEGVIVMSDGTLVYPDGTIVPTYLQHGDEELGGNLIRTEDGGVTPWMPEVPPPTFEATQRTDGTMSALPWNPGYVPPVPEEKFEHPMHSVPEPTPSHHDYTPHTPSHSPVHVETPSYSAPEPSHSYSSPSDSSPSYSSPSDSSPSYSE